MITFGSLAYGVVFVVLSLWLVVKSVWPVHRDGRPYTLEEMSELMKKLPPTPKLHNGRFGFILLSAVTLIAVVLSAAKL